jgi:phage regulator Rha-like protein/phage antirepressor YoqD-like protein
MDNSIGGNDTPIVSINGGQPVTTSLAIAEGVGNPHKSVIQLIRQNASDLEEFGPLAFGMRKGGALPQGGFAKATEYAILNEQQSTLLLTYMRNNDVVREFKKRLVKAFFEMRDSTAKSADPMKALSDPATMRGLLLSYSEKVLELESQVTEQAPKVDAYQRLSDAEGSLCITDAAKYLQVKRKDLINYLYSNGWIYRRVGNKNWLAYDAKRKQQLVTHKATTYTLDDGTEKLNEQVRITPKGLAKLALTFRKDAA